MSYRNTTEAPRRLRPIRVVPVPGPGSSPYVDGFCGGLEQAGMQVVSLRSRAAKMFHFDILHLHFPEHYVTERPPATAALSALALLGYTLIARLLRKKVVWTVHDVLPSRPRHTWILWSYLRGMRGFTNAFVFMSRASEAQFFDTYGRPKRVATASVPHGSFDVVHLSSRQRDEMRREMVGDAPCLLIGFIGEIKRYKNIDALLLLPREDADGRPIRFLVAGLPYHGEDSRLVEAVLDKIGRDRIIRIAERPSDRRLAELLQIVDVVMLPYVRGWNSGAAMIALSCHARILCSALPMFRELAEHPAAPWVYVFDHEAKDPAASLGAALSQFCKDSVDSVAVNRLEAFLAETSFSEGAQRLKELYLRLIETVPDKKGNAEGSAARNA